LAVQVTDTPIFDQTLSEVLLRARLEVEAAQARCVEAERRVAHAERQARVRQALVSDAVEERVRADEPDDENDGVTTPTVPSMSDLLRTSTGVDRFFDSLLGAPVAERS
jgi:hypothetical protein